MVVYRKEPNNLDPLTGTTAAQSVEEATEDAGKSANAIGYMVPRAVLTQRPNSHPFQDRHLSLDQPIKVGRSVARCRQTTNNAIFDCKVLSRNHALLWYENGKFYLQDTKSSNGTFINNQRLSKSSEESPPREVCSGDIVQFGVDVVENSRKGDKVVHGCIVASVKLYLPDGKEAKASPTTAVTPLAPETYISSHELYQLSQYLQEALHREQVLENKLGTLQKVVINTQDESDIGWKALIEEDRLLSRIETLESQLQTCGKNVTEEKLKDDVVKLQDDKDKYQVTAKESLKKILQEKLDVIRKVQDLENSLSNTENECSHLMDSNQKKEKEIHILLEKNSECGKEISSLSKKLQEVEEKFLDLQSQNAEDKLALENNAEEMRKEEQILSNRIEALKAENDFAKEQLNAMKAHFDILKKDRNDETIEKNGNLSAHDELNTTDRDNKAEQNLVTLLTNEVNRLEVELQKVQKENMKNDMDGNSDSETETDECFFNGDVKTNSYICKLQDDIVRLKKLLSDSQDHKKAVDDELEKAMCLLNTIRAESDPTKQQGFLDEMFDLLHKDPSKSATERNSSAFYASPDSWKHSKEAWKFRKECEEYKSRIKSLETDIMRRMIADTTTQILSQREEEPSSTEGSSSTLVKQLSDDLTLSTESELEENAKKLLNAQEEIILIKERFEECNKEKSYLQGELNNLKEQIQLLSVQAKTVSVCSFVPLIVLAVAMMLAFYPTLAHFTATSDQM